MYRHKTTKKSLREALEYSPEKVDTFIPRATKDATDLKRVFAALAAKVGGMSIYDVQDDIGKAQELLKKIGETKRYSEKAYDTYYKIIDMYDYTDMPQNVKQLEKLVDELDTVTTNIKYLENALDNIMDAAKDFNRFTLDTEL